MRPLAALALSSILLAADGQGPVDSGPIVIQDFNLGTYWYGARITNKDLLGKVVLVETWGS
ncbi:MAG: hypothetical protein ACYTHK_05990 [Planctomycetota bacterium]|jgi:hypothetical protein